MPLSFVQQGVIAQMEFAKLLMMGSNGKLEIATPMTDDERRDAEVHLHGAFGRGLAFQVKSARRLFLPPHSRTRVLRISFTVKADRLVSDPRFWYFFAQLESKIMGFPNPVFVVDSETVHKHAAPRLYGRMWYFSFMASMGATARDQWVSSRVEPLEVGQRVLEIVNDLQKMPRAQRPVDKFNLPPGATLVRTTATR